MSEPLTTADSGLGLAQHADSALEERAAQLRSVFASAVTGMTLLAPDGRLLQTNVAFRELVGRSEAELLELSFFDLVHPGDRDLARARHEQRLAGDLAAGRVGAALRARERAVGLDAA